MIKFLRKINKHDHLRIILTQNTQRCNKTEKPEVKRNSQVMI